MHPRLRRWRDDRRKLLSLDTTRRFAAPAMLLLLAACSPDASSRTGGRERR